MQTPSGVSPSIIIEIDNRYEGKVAVPALEVFEKALLSTLNLLIAERLIEDSPAEYEVCISIVGNDEIQALNQSYRGKDKPTNVLSFPSDLPDDIDINLLGDIIIAADIVAQESAEQNKKTHDHWVHMSTHSLLHLFGFDHISDEEAAIMEGIEIRTLSQLGISNPYELK